MFLECSMTFMHVSYDNIQLCGNWQALAYLGAVAAYKESGDYCAR